MTAYVALGGSWKQVVNTYVAVGGVWKRVVDAYIADGGVWKHTQTQNSYKVQLSTNSLSGVSTQRSNGGTSPVTANPMNGVAPYTYSWTRSTGDTSIVCSSPTSQSTSFHGAVNQGPDTEAIWICTVTDSAGHVASDSVDVSILGAGRY